MWIVKLALRRPYTFVVMTLLVPGNAVMIRADGPKVMTVDAQNAIRFRPVKLGRDLGDKVEILSGLGAGDSIVANPNDALHEGLEVKVQVQPAKKILTNN
jgi:membrane fusion protein, multidrug efflux system